MEFLANCLHDLTALGPGGVPAVMTALFLAGLAGGATHCAGMCGPFVIAQATAVADRAAGGGLLARLSGAALLPYHLGRMLGYGALGAAAGGFAGVVALGTGFRFLLAALLALAALLMFAQASARVAALLPRLPAPRLPGGLERRLGALLAAPTGLRGVALGLMLSALPCGLLYGALAGAAATGSALGGALAMVAFVAGTVPALVGVALLGRFFGRRAGPGMRVAGAALFALNGAMLAAMAVRVAA
ncbi:sulfite exporter TauE/SafE family protein [Roseomonas eburnea]|uniref:Sulfite exporter TauE/SafE family protein n=1 Tax=Neoroseomonas eburnea TaxID=1346889 RepID=A0A9X9XA98_9PROT|nr:sulfite exporter TauE/SafE family protein [Neoroseomonas eburnea]MBR0680634.1 sulfite exporter TauE/SafE family protein [Neoroseomonas eburnea]